MRTEYDPVPSLPADPLRLSIRFHTMETFRIYENLFLCNLVEMQELPLSLVHGIPLMNSAKKIKKTFLYRPKKSEEKRKKAALRRVPINEESELSKQKRTSANANDIESNPGPPMAILQWMENFLIWERSVQQRKSIQTTVAKHTNDLYEDSIEQSITEDLYTEKNMLVLQNFQNIYLTNPATMIESEMIDKLSYLYNAWYTKIREKEKIEAKQVSVSVDTEEATSLKSSSEPSNAFQFRDGGGTKENTLIEIPTKRKRRTQAELRDEGLQCNFCLRSFSRKDTLRKHISDTHPIFNDQPFSDQAFEAPLHVNNEPFILVTGSNFSLTTEDFRDQAQSTITSGSSVATSSFELLGNQISSDLVFASQQSPVFQT